MIFISLNSLNSWIFGFFKFSIFFDFSKIFEFFVFKILIFLNFLNFLDFSLSTKAQNDNGALSLRNNKVCFLCPSLRASHKASVARQKVKITLNLWIATICACLFLWLAYHIYCLSYKVLLAKSLNSGQNSTQKFNAKFSAKFSLKSSKNSNAFYKFLQKIQTNLNKFKKIKKIQSFQNVSICVYTLLTLLQNVRLLARIQGTKLKG